LTAEEIRDFFDCVIDPICERIDEMDRRLIATHKEPVSTRKFLTGGLAGNQYFQKRMKEKYSFTLYDALYTRDLAVGELILGNIATMTTF
jgi:hypothetical protein